MSWRLRRAAGESDAEFATRRLKVAGGLTVAAAVASLLWWLAYSAIDSTEPAALFLMLCITGLLVLVLSALLLVLLAALLSWSWFVLERRSPALQRVRLRLAVLWERVLPAFMVLGSGFVLGRAIVTGEIPHVARGLRGRIAVADDPGHAAVLWLIWLAIFLVGLIWLLARLGNSRR